MARYRKRPVLIEAFQLTESTRESNADWPEWAHEAWNKSRGSVGSLHPTQEHTGHGTLSVGTLEGEMLVNFGDYIIQGIQGEIYPCKPDIFEATYDILGLGAM